jgi:hypothetical protein
MAGCGNVMAQIDLGLDLFVSQWMEVRGQALGETLCTLGYRMHVFNAAISDHWFHSAGMVVCCLHTTSSLLSFGAQKARVVAWKQNQLALHVLPFDTAGHHLVVALARTIHVCSIIFLVRLETSTRRHHGCFRLRVQCMVFLSRDAVLC